MTPVQDYPQDVPAAPTPTPAEDTAAAIGVEDGAAGLSGYAGVSTAGGESAVSEDDRHSEVCGTLGVRVCTCRAERWAGDTRCAPFLDWSVCFFLIRRPSFFIFLIYFRYWCL